MSEAVVNGDVELWTTPLGKWFPRSEMMAKALELWPMHVVEEALGDEADGILPEAIRSAEPRVRLPRHHIDMLHYRADQQETTVSGVLKREFGRHRQRAHRRAVGGAAGVRRGDGVAGVIDEKAYPQMTQMNADGRRFYLRTSASSADKPWV